MFNLICVVGKINIYLFIYFYLLHEHLHIRIVHTYEHLATTLVSLVLRHPDQKEGTPPKPSLSLALSSGLYNHTYVDMRNT